MESKDWLYIGILMFGGGGFWVWVRSHIIQLTADMAVLKAWAQTVDFRCKERGRDMEKIFNKIDSLKTAIGNKDTETAKALGRIEGKLDK